MSTKPQVTNNSETLTDTIVTTTNQDVKTAKPVNASRAVNAYGVTVLRGGNVLGSSFIDSIIDAYTNVLSYQPVALVLLIISTIYYLTAILDVKRANPFVLMHASVVSAHTEHDSPLLKSITALFTGITHFFLVYDKYIALVCATAFPYLTKPSSRNAITSVIVGLYLLLSRADALTVLVMSHLFFLLVQLRAPKHKAIIISVAVLAFVIGHENLLHLSNAAGHNHDKMINQPSSTATGGKIKRSILSTNNS